MCYQTHDLFRAMQDDGARLDTVRVDGGMVNNNWLSQYLANILGIQVDRPQQTETTALGAAYLAGLQAGVYSSLDDLSRNWQLDKSFNPDLDNELRQRNLEAWADAVERTRSRG